MAPTAPTVTEPGLRLHPNVLVALRFTGASLVPRDDIPWRKVGLTDLVLLEQLAVLDGRSRHEIVRAVAETTGASVAEIETTLDSLIDRGTITVGPDVAARQPIDRGWARAQPVERPAEDQFLSLALPMTLRPTAEGFETVDPEGRRTLCLSAAELHALTAFCQVGAIEAARTAAAVTEAGLDDEQLDQLVERLLAHGLLRIADPSALTEHVERSQLQMRMAVAAKMRLRRAVNAHLAELDEREAAILASTGVRRTRVVPVHGKDGYLPLGLGMILSCLLADEGGQVERHYQIRPDWLANERHVDEITSEPTVFLFSNYLWSHADNLERSRQIKAAAPGCLTIHGGPDTPKYEEDTRSYLAANPHVDIAVHGEGEIATKEILAALAGTLGGPGPFDLAPLRDVPGISFVLDGEFVRTGPRERLGDLNVIPSPFLVGLFDAYLGLPNLNLIIETNRGCPYGCTYCDWGTATMARIRKFDMDRVLAELDWAAKAQATTVALADANFGIFERDVQIAERVVELKQATGFPIACVASYAKNTVKHLEKIIASMVDSGMVARGVLSLQTMDVATLDAVRRSNIKTAKYDELARQFRRRGLPLYVDLMMGLPGATVTSFVNDLQSCVEREVRVKIHETELLPNSPMNEPAYREEHAIQVRRPGQPGTPGRDMVVVATSTMSVEDFEYMRRLRTPFLVGENFGVLRHMSRYLRCESDAREVDLYLRILECADDPQRWPALDFLVRSMRGFLAPPMSWRHLLDEVTELMVTGFGVPDDSALKTVVDVQAAVLPAVGRPERVALDLDHDYVTWHDLLIEAKFDGGDWPSKVPSLRSLGPAPFVADDPDHLSNKVLGIGLQGAWLDTWELRSPVSRSSQ